MTNPWQYHRIEFTSSVDFEEWLKNYNVETDLTKIKLAKLGSDNVLEFPSPEFDYWIVDHELVCCETNDSVGSVSRKEGRIRVEFW